MNGPYHDDVDERLCDWVDGRMSERDRDRFAAELRVNASLRHQLAEYERTVAAIRAALRAPTTPVPMADRVITALAAQQNRAAQPIAAFAWRGRSWTHLGFCAASAAALLLLALWIDSWAGRAPEKLASTDAAQAEVPLEAKKDVGVESVDTQANGGASRRDLRDESGQALRKLDPAPAPVDPAAANAAQSSEAQSSGAPSETGEAGGAGSKGGAAEQRERLAEPKPPAAGAGRVADGAPRPDDSRIRYRDGAKSAEGAESATTAEKERAGADKAAGEPRGEAGRQPVGVLEDFGPRDVVPPGGQGTAGPTTAGPAGPVRYGNRGSPPTVGGGGGGAVGAPPADAPWPELTIVGTQLPVAELSDRSRVLLGFVAADDEVAKLAAKRAAEPSEGKAKSDAKPSGDSVKPSSTVPPATALTPTALTPAELPALLATFLRSAATTPASELRWPTRGGGLVLRRLPPERADDADTVWIADGASDELRLLLGQVGAVANEARWQVHSGEFAPELVKRVLAAELPSTPSSPAATPTQTPAETVAGGTKEQVPTPTPGRGVVPAEPAAGSASRRRVVLRFRLKP